MSQKNEQLNILDIKEWVKQDESEFRQAIHMILLAIGEDPDLSAQMILKGGILMAIRYGSPRFTKDIDFSSADKLDENGLKHFRTAFESALRHTIAKSDYGLDLRVQKFNVKPPNQPDASFPSVNMTVGYAPKGTRKHERLRAGSCPDIVAIDFSLNETILGLEEIGGNSIPGLKAYAFEDLVAEKYRALLQQRSRNRFRRQDVYDLRLLIERNVTGSEQDLILKSLLAKCKARQIMPDRRSLLDPEVKRRAGVDYLTNEIAGELPDFDLAYQQVESFFSSLPWLSA